MRYATPNMSQNCAFCAGVHGSSGGIAGRAESFRSRAVSIADGRRSLVVLAAEVTSWPVWITEPVSKLDSLCVPEETGVSAPLGIGRIIAMVPGPAVCPGAYPACAGAVAVFGCFAPDGPRHCSGLPVARYNPAQLARQIGANWLMVSQDREEHITPAGTIQPFTWIALRRRP